jgi:hypothetical protein
MRFLSRLINVNFAYGGQKHYIFWAKCQMTDCCAITFEHSKEPCVIGHQRYNSFIMIFTREYTKYTAGFTIYFVVVGVPLIKLASISAYS